MKYFLIVMIAMVSLTANACKTTFPNTCSPGVGLVERGGSFTPNPGPWVDGSTPASVNQQAQSQGQSVSPAETAALFAVHTANSKANTNRWETLVCSMRPVKGKTIEGILFRNEIPFWYNCND